MSFILKVNTQSEDDAFAFNFKFASTIQIETIIIIISKLLVLNLTIYIIYYLKSLI